MVRHTPMLTHRSPAHRIPLMNPGLKRIGYGQRQHPTRGWVTVLDSGSGR